MWIVYDEQNNGGSYVIRNTMITPLQVYNSINLLGTEQTMQKLKISEEQIMDCFYFLKEEFKNGY